MPRHVQLENDKNAALLLARKDGQTTLLDLKLPALDLAEFNIAGAPGYSKQFFMFGPRDLYRPVKQSSSMVYCVMQMVKHCPINPSS